ncbi:histone deacetylase family protein [Amylibacter marinus]|uniref:histone deacetylase family protein n=1 Tax=Amylibacter marinus TaxID=1475483 RepID=UPI0032AED238
MTIYLTHSDCLEHVTPSGHPEQVARLRAINQRLDRPEFDRLHRIDAPLGTKQLVSLAHPAQYFDRIQAACPATGVVSLDGDTHVMNASFNAALRGVGAICHAVDLILQAKDTNAFCATRPPGHHAEAETPMGFCLFGTAAIGAKYALKQAGINRVAVVDFDVHHGNGTQDLVWNDPEIILVTSQEMPLWPGTGDATERGAHENVINIPLSAGASGADLMDHYHQNALPALVAHAPDLLIISAGFDAHCADPLAGLAFTTADYTEITKMLCDFADQHCHGRVVSTLEGGYDLDALADSVAAHVSVLMEHSR